jgi:hypothetical protein
MIYGRFFGGTKHGKMIELRDNSDVWFFMTMSKRGCVSLKETYQRVRYEQFELVNATFRFNSVMPSQGSDTFYEFKVRECNREALDKLECLYEDYIYDHATCRTWHREMLGEWPESSRRTATEVRLQQEAHYRRSRRMINERSVAFPSWYEQENFIRAINNFDPLNKPKQEIKDATLAMKDSEDVHKQLEQIAAKGRKHLRALKK